MFVSWNGTHHRFVISGRWLRVHFFSFICNIIIQLIRFRPACGWYQLRLINVNHISNSGFLFSTIAFEIGLNCFLSFFLSCVFLFLFANVCHERSHEDRLFNDVYICKSIAYFLKYANTMSWFRHFNGFTWISIAFQILFFFSATPSSTRMYDTNYLSLENNRSSKCCNLSSLMVIPIELHMKKCRRRRLLLLFFGEINA